MDYVGLGRRIKSARRAQSLTQERLAETVGISLSFLGHIERGSRKASLDTLVKLANTLGESLDDLLKDSLNAKPKESAKAPIEALDDQVENVDILNELSHYVGSIKDGWND